MEARLGEAPDDEEAAGAHAGATTEDARRSRLVLEVKASLTVDSSAVREVRPMASDAS